MEMALKQAKIAFDQDEVPVGAVLVRDGEILSSDHNRVEQLIDPTAHAEILVLRRASQYVNNWRLKDSCLYVTLEPCPMCMGAILLARVSRLVWAAFDPRMGGSKLSMKWSESCRWSATLSMRGGVLQDESLQLVQTFFFFQRKRKGGSSP